MAETPEIIRLNSLRKSHGGRSGGTKSPGTKTPNLYTKESKAEMLRRYLYEKTVSIEKFRPYLSDLLLDDKLHCDYRKPGTKLNAPSEMLYAGYYRGIEEGHIYVSPYPDSVEKGLAMMLKRTIVHMKWDLNNIVRLYIDRETEKRIYRKIKRSKSTSSLIRTAH